MNRQRAMIASLVAFAAMGCDSPDPSPTGSVQPIVGGEDVEAGTMPYMVALFSTLEPAGTTPADRHFCGGTLIDAEAGLVVTAAHCVTMDLHVRDDLCDGDPECAAEFDTEWVDRAFPPEWLEVTVGSHALSAIVPSDFRAVTEVIVHPLVNGETIEYDIALLRVSGVDPETPTPRWLGDEPLDSWLILPGRRATVAGWGALGENDDAPDILQSVEVPIFERGLCRALIEFATGSEVDVRGSMLCAGHFWGGRDACDGDSGGPLTVPDRWGEPALAGVVSWGEGCARPFAPGVYAHVLELRPWTASCEVEGDVACRRLPEIPEHVVNAF